MAAVGGWACEFVKGPIAEPRQGVLVWTVPGLNGFGAKRVGLREGEFEILAVKYGSNATVNTWLALIEALQGQVVSIIDDHGDTYTNRLVTRISPPLKRAAQPYGIRCEIKLTGIAV